MEAFKFLLDNADRISSFVLLIILVAALGYVSYALAVGKIPSPGDYKRQGEDLKEVKATCSKTEATLDETREELSEARVLHKGSEVRIEFLERALRDRDNELTDLRAKFVRIETELDVLRRDSYRRNLGTSEGSAT